MMMRDDILGYLLVQGFMNRAIEEGNLKQVKITESILDRMLAVRFQRAIT